MVLLLSQYFSSTFDNSGITRSLGLMIKSKLIPFLMLALVYSLKSQNVYFQFDTPSKCVNLARLVAKTS